VRVTLAIQTIQASRGPGDPASRIPGIAVLVVLLLIVIAGVAGIVSPRWRRGPSAWLPAASPRPI